MPHCYDKDGNPHFDLAPRHAKEKGLYFSVTEIQKVEAQPGLEMWKTKVMLEEAYWNPAQDNEDEKQFAKRVRNALYGDDTASGLGTRIHDGIEHVLGGTRKLQDLPAELIPYVEPAEEYFQMKGFVVKHLEKVVVNEEDGYAGMCDVIAETAKGQKFILDWKSTKNIPSKPYPNHPEQISAYAVAHYGRDAVMNGEVWGCNAYISTTKKDADGCALFRPHSYRPEVLAEAYKIFDMVNNLWRIRNNYDPRS